MHATLKSYKDISLDWERFDDTVDKHVGKERFYATPPPGSDFDAETVPELRQKPPYTTPSGWWWCIESVFRIRVAQHSDVDPQTHEGVSAMTFDMSPMWLGLGRYTPERERGRRTHIRTHFWRALAQ